VADALDSIELLPEEALVVSSIGNDRLDETIVVAGHEMRFEDLRDAASTRLQRASSFSSYYVTPTKSQSHRGRLARY